MRSEKLRQSAGTPATFCTSFIFKIYRLKRFAEATVAACGKVGTRKKHVQGSRALMHLSDVPVLLLYILKSNRTSTSTTFSPSGRRFRWSESHPFISFCFGYRSYSSSV